MLELLFWISAKKNVVALALLGAAFVTIAPQISKWEKWKKNSGSDHKRILLAQALEKKIVRIGYSFVCLSVTLFIIAGFIVDLK